MKKIYIIILLIILSLVGCAKKEAFSIESKLLTEKIQLDDNIVIPLSYYKPKSTNSLTYLLKNNSIKKDDEIYLHACSDTVPSNAIKRIGEKLNFNKSFLEIDESLIKYSSNKDYEVFFVESSDRLTWKIYILKDGQLKEITIQHNEKMNMQEVQIDKNNIYIFSKKIYKVNLIEYTTELILDIEKEMGLDGTGNKVFIKDNICVMAINSYSSKDKKNKGLLIKYDIKNKEFISIEDKDRFNQIFPYKSGFVAICSQNETWNPLIKYYDSELNLSKEKEINIDSEYGHVIFGYYGNLAYMFNNRIYTCMEVDASHIREIVIIDVESSEILYQQEISYKNRNGFTLSGPSFYRMYNKKLIDLKRF